MIFFFLVLLLVFPAAMRAQQLLANLPSIAQIEQLYESGRFEEIVRLAPASPANSPKMDLYRGLALARLQRWKEAKLAFQAGHAKEPGNPRFLAELAGVEYKLKNFRAAKAYLHGALRTTPADAYSRNFLATIYFLEGNLDAALKNWNRIGKPKIADISMTPEPRLSNALLERAFTIAPLSELTLGELRTTEARFDNLGIFPMYRFELVPSTAQNSQSSFALNFHSVERNGWGAGTLDGLLSLFRGAPYLTVNPEFYNLGHSARNLTSLFRWDDNKRRAFVSFSQPLDENPKWRFTLHADARNENWDLAGAFRGSLAPLSDLNLEKIEAGADFRSAESGRWSWQIGISYAYRRFRNVTNVAPAVLPFFTSSASLDYHARVGYQLLHLPERRITLGLSARGSFGKNFARTLGPIGSTEGSLALRWFPRVRGDDYETTMQLRAGGFFGHATLDELYQLGIERDTDLQLHGIAGTRGGRKGSAPLGREFFLFNGEMDKNIYSNGIVNVRIGPTFDAGRIADASGYFGSSGWLWDPGVALKLRVLGSVGVVLSYAHDIPTGSHAIYAAPIR